MMEEQDQSSRVELVLDTFRVFGQLTYFGVPRRLVDILNNAEQPFVLLKDADVDDPLRSDDVPRHFDMVQVHLNTVLFAVPRGEGVQAKNPLEAVRKVPVSSMLALPGFEITGKIHLLPDLVPEGTQIMGARHYIPVTDAVVVSAVNHAVVWREEVVIVNLARAVLFGTHLRAVDDMAQTA